MESSLRFTREVFLVLDGHSPRSVPFFVALGISRVLDVLLDPLAQSEAKTSGPGWKLTSGIARLLKFKERCFGNISERVGTKAAGDENVTVGDC